MIDVTQTTTPRKTTAPLRQVRSIADIEAIEATPYDTNVPARSLYDLFCATAEAHGDRPALTVLHAPDPAELGTKLTHRELLAEITRAANLFRGLGLTPDHGVAAFLAPTLPEFPALLLGAQVAGVASSINYLLSADAIADLLRAEEATILVIPSAQLDAMCWAKARDLLTQVPSLDHVLVIGGAGTLPTGFTALAPVLDAQNAAALDFAMTQGRDDICALFHTGGTTGKPKLVPLTHGNQIHAAFGFGQVFGYDDTDTVLNGFPLFHVGGTMTVGLSVLAAGGHMVIPSPYALRPPEVISAYWPLVEALGVTVVSGVPTSLGALTTAWDGGADVCSVRMAVTGGAALPAAIGKRFEATTGIKVYETYGMTETAAAIAFSPAHAERVAGSVGLRAPYSEIRIIEAMTNPTPCPPGVSGLVQVRGPQVFCGYVGADPVPADGWFTTGDVGYLTQEARLVLTGREKDLIVRSGHNIDPAAIEAVANSAPDVDISAAVAMPDQYAGEVPVLFVVPRAGDSVDISALHDHLTAGLHEPPARPRRILTIDALPVTAVGKVFKPALRDQAIAEKVRLELEQIDPEATARTRVITDPQKRLVVEVLVEGASADDRERLRQTLAPLPQTYHVIGSSVSLSHEDGVATLTLNRPKALNAASKVLMWSLEGQLDRLMTLPDIRAVILTGAGRGFCAGGDLVEFGAELAQGEDALVTTLAYNQRVISMIEALPMPVIAAVNGVAVAGGLEMILCCDLVLAAQGARIGDGHAKYGILPTGGATARLSQRIGPTRAAHLFYTAELLSAETARDWGLVGDVVAPEALLPRAQELAQKIAANSPRVLAEIKSLIGPDAANRSPEARLGAEIDRFAAYQNGPDLAEGLAAFGAKRTPRFAPRSGTAPGDTPMIAPEEETQS